MFAYSVYLYAIREKQRDHLTMSTISPKRRKIGGRILVCLRCCKCDLNASLLQESMNRKLCEYHAIDGNWFGFIVSLILPISFRITMCVCVCVWAGVRVWHM